MGKAAENEKHKMKANFYNNIAASFMVTGLVVPYLAVVLKTNELAAGLGVKTGGARTIRNYVLNARKSCKTCCPDRYQYPCLENRHDPSRSGRKRTGQNHRLTGVGTDEIGGFLGLLPPEGSATEGMVDGAHDLLRKGHDDHDPAHPAALVDRDVGQFDVLQEIGH